MKDWTDKAKETRKGEDLDEQKLGSFLNRHFGTTAELTIKQFPSGFSNLTYQLDYGNTTMVLRRAPHGARIKSGHDMHREYNILQKLYPHYPKVPKPILYHENAELIGTAFYLMEKVNGVILRAQMPMEMIPPENVMKRICKSFVKTLGELHQLDVNAIGLSDFGKPKGYVQRQVTGWSKRYLAAKTEEVPKLEASARWLEDHLPVESTKISLVHNDFKYDNLVLDPKDWSHVISVLDWEMATIGDPMMDLGTTLGYWINYDDPDFMKNLGLSPTTVSGNLKREAIVALYEKVTGATAERIEFYYVFGLFKIAVIVQQIYKRYHEGLTKDPRFSQLNKVVQMLGELTQLVIHKKRLDNLM